MFIHCDKVAHGPIMTRPLYEEYRIWMDIMQWYVFTVLINNYTVNPKLPKSHIRPHHKRNKHKSSVHE